jgi:hypothetical protein
MTTTTLPTTEAEIFAEIMSGRDSQFTPEIARLVLTWRFTPRQQQRMQQLAELGNERELNAAERAEAERFRRIGTLLTTLHSKARLVLQSSVPAT